MVDQEALHNIEIDLVEQYNTELYCPQGSRMSNGWARLTIDMTLLTEAQRNKVYQAEQLLHEVGINFDTGSGGGGRDWELDWSLTGANVTIRPLVCMLCHTELMPKEATFAHLYDQEYSHNVYTRSYCSEEHLKLSLDESDRYQLLAMEQYRAVD